MFTGMQCITTLLLISIIFSAVALNNPAIALFGYKESPRSNLNLFPQWLSVLEQHVMHTVDILKGLEFDGPVIKIIEQKSERPDGKGYPAGLTAENIMQEAKKFL